MLFVDLHHRFFFATWWQLKHLNTTQMLYRLSLVKLKWSTSKRFINTSYSIGAALVFIWSWFCVQLTNSSPIIRDYYVM